MRCSALLAVALVAGVALGCDPGAIDDAGVDASGARCLDDATLERCEAGGCERATCRGDELCVAAECVDWRSAPLSASFTVERLGGLRVGVRVDPGGFPRAQVESLRFDFGDGAAGHGEPLTHDYEAPGRYLVTLAVRLTGHRVLRAEALVELDPPADARALALTVNGIEPQMNGSRPVPRGGVDEPIRLHVPPRGFTVDVTRLTDAPLSLTTEPDLGGELIERVVFDGRRGRWVVDPPAPLGPLTLTLTDGSSTESLTVEVVPFGPERDPFDRPMVWLLRDDRDLFTTARSGDGAAFTLVSAPGPNGTPDLHEELTLIGAQGPDAALNDRYLTWIREGIRREVYRVFGMAPDGAPQDDIAFTVAWLGEPGAPDPSAFDPAGAFSMMALGGTLEGFLGYSEIAPYNEERVDDSAAGLGIATSTLIGILTSTPVATDALNPIKVGVGAPVGTHPHDAEVLDPTFDPYASHPPEVLARYRDLSDIARWLALAIASVTAHEMGHAMGLMPNGLPPGGFFGDEGEVAFVGPRTDSFHADLPGLNLMQAGGNYLDVLDEVITTIELPRGGDLIELAEILALETRLSPLSRAYLQRRLTYENASVMVSGHAACR